MAKITTIHINAPIGSIAPFVIIAGDPLRTKVMSKHFLTNLKLVSDVRNNFIYTGDYKGVKVSIATSGMGVSSMAIYVQELYQFYGVQVIVRAGSCGTFATDLKLLDLVHVNKAYSNLKYYPSFYSSSWAYPSLLLQKKIAETANKTGSTLIENVTANTVADFYIQDVNKTWAENRIYGWKVLEMESYILFIIAKLFNRHAGCLLTVSDQLIFTDPHHYQVVSSLDHKQKVDAFLPMFQLILETCIRWK